MGSDRIHHSTTVLNYFVLSFTNFVKTMRERERRKCQLCPDIRGGGGGKAPLAINYKLIRNYALNFCSVSI